MDRSESFSRGIEKRDRRDSRGDEREGHRRKRNRIGRGKNRRNKKTFTLYPYLLQRWQALPDYEPISDAPVTEGTRHLHNTRPPHVMYKVISLIYGLQYVSYSYLNTANYSCNLNKSCCYGALFQWQRMNFMNASIPVIWLP